MAFRTVRIGQRRGRPIAAGGGRNGSASAHSASVRHVAYGLAGRASCARAAGVHIGDLRRRQTPPERMRPPPLTSLYGEVSVAAVLEEGALDAESRCVLE